MHCDNFGAPMCFLFGCPKCGCPSIKVPEELTPGSAVTCRACDAPIGTWNEFKTQMTRAILAESGEGQVALARASHDPLVVELAPAQLRRQSAA